MHRTFRLFVVISLFALAYVACVTSVDRSDRSATGGRVAVVPAPVEAGETYPHLLGVRISPPWPQEGAWVLRAPETLGSNFGVLFIDHEVETMPPISRPVSPVAWRTQPDGSHHAAVELRNGVFMLTKVVPGARDVTIIYQVTNGFEHPLSNLGLQFCLVQTGVTGFEDPRGERTFIYSGGEFISLARTTPGLPPNADPPMFIVTNTHDLPPWGPMGAPSWGADQQGDIPLIATVSQDGGRIIALAFDNAYKIMSNCHIPCIHADPALADCAVGETVETRGKIYFVEGTLDELLPLFRRDFPDWTWPKG